MEDARAKVLEAIDILHEARRTHNNAIGKLIEAKAVLNEAERVKQDTEDMICRWNEHAGQPE